MFDLWIVPPPNHSVWFSRIDWYLNWQMCKGQAHQLPPPQAELYRLAEEHGLTIEIPKAPAKAPLMIGGDGLIPAKSCVVVDYDGDLKQWLTEAKTLAFQLQAGRAQIYLPAGTSKEKALKLWDKLSGDCAADFVEDTQEIA